MIKHLTSCLLIAAASVGVVYGQTNSSQTFQEITIERNADPGVLITLSPPTSAITPYTVIWPATGPATTGLALVTTNNTNPYQLGWQVPVSASIELVESTNGSLRRVPALNEGGIVGVPGSYSNDFSGSRDNASQTASGDYALIGGGMNNTASGDWSLVLGGEGNTSSGNYSAVVGGQANEASGAGSGILAGFSNQNAGQNAVIGGGEDNTITAAGTAGFIGGGEDNSVSAANGFVGGGHNNSVTGANAAVGGGENNTACGEGAFVGGGSNNSACGQYAVVIGGNSNSSSGQYAFIGGGESNTSSGQSAAIGGGTSNTASGSWSVVGGGNTNANSQNYGFIGGGQNNTLSTGTHSALVGGSGNTITGTGSFIGAGQNNNIQSDYAAIPGGRNMALASGADGSFGFNSGSSNMSVSAPATAVFANADVWLANNDNTPRQLRFYEAYNTAGTFPSSANYIAFQAPTSTNSNLNNTYTLPDRIGGSGQVLRLASGATTTAGTLEWGEAMTHSAGTVNVTADDQAITAAQMDRVTFLRLSSNGTSANRTVTLANGVVGGLRLIIRCVAGAGQGIELTDGANLELNGNATLGDGDTISLIWDDTSSVWVEIDRSDN
ncbi:MAG: hypothetical protein J5I53_04330 [Bradyrhizobiaceae bacterium]|nr:hypothetical protein [Bradyrhizobiaceae bacterium]